MTSLMRLLGASLRGIRPGLPGLMFYAAEFASVPATITLSSPAFQDGLPMPARYTADGEGLSPPLAWTGVPPGSKGLILLVEDAGLPGPFPLVHAIAPWLPPHDGCLAEGEMPVRRRSPAGERMGRNSSAGRTWLPPSPPPGHGPHRYAFQLFALDQAPDFPHPPGRSAVRRALRGHLTARGCLTGTYERR